MKSWGTIKLIYVSFVFCCVLTSCATIQGPLKGDSIAPRKLSKHFLKNDQSLVFGTLHISIGGGGFKRNNHNYMIVSRSDTEYSGWLRTNFSDRFYWRLPAGTYEISSIMPDHINNRNIIEPTPLTFIVPEAGKAYYIGDLKIDIKGKSRFWLKDIIEGINDVKIIDNYIGAKEYVERQNAFWVGKIEKSLMTYDESIEPEEITIIKRADSKYKSMMYPLEWAESIPYIAPPLGP